MRGNRLRDNILNIRDDMRGTIGMAMHLHTLNYKCNDRNVYALVCCGYLTCSKKLEGTHVHVFLEVFEMILGSLCN